MILVLGSGEDHVYPQLLDCLRESGHSFAVVDEDQPDQYSVRWEETANGPVFRLFGGDCDGRRSVGSIFVRHAVARTLNPQHLQQMGRLQAHLNYMLFSTSCPVINKPCNAYSNYSKPYQVGLLAEAGFDVPKTLVTNITEEAHRFIQQGSGQVIFKGVSNVPTLARVMTQDDFSRLDLLPDCPTLFQEYIDGLDYRVHVIGEAVFVTSLKSKDEDYRRSALIEKENIQVDAATLPKPIIRKAVAFTKELGLIVSGIDFKEDSKGRLVALELNPYPQFTFYGRRSGQPITDAVVKYLIEHQLATSNVYA